MRASSISRSVAHTCHPVRLRTGWYPSVSPTPSRRTRDQRQQRLDGEHRQRAERHPAQRARGRLAQRRRVADDRPDHEQPARGGDQREAATAAPRSRRTPPPSPGAAERAGRARAWRAAPTNTAGDPAQSSPGGTDRSTAEPAARSRRSARRGCPGRGCCGCRRWRPRRSGSARRAARRRRASGRSRSTSGSIAAPLAEGEQSRDRRQRVQVDVPADLGPERPRVVGDPRRAGQVVGPRRCGQPLGEPQPQVHAAAARVAPGPQPAQQRPGRPARWSPSGRAG